MTGASAPVYQVQFPDDLCGCGLPLTRVARARIAKREERKEAFAPASAPSRAPAREVVAAGIPAAALPAPTSKHAKLEIEFLRTLRAELEGLTPDEREALRDDYKQQVVEAQRGLESLMRTLALIEAFVESRA